MHTRRLEFPGHLTLSAAAFRRPGETHAMLFDELS